MATWTERTLAFGFGLLGGLLFLVAALVSFGVGMADTLLGRWSGAVDAGSAAVLLAVVGGLALFFAYLGHREWSNRPIVTGAALVAVAVIGWVTLAAGVDLLTVLAAIFVFLAGLLTLASPIASGRLAPAAG